MPTILDQATVFQEFNNVIPAAISDPLRPHIAGGHAELHRYTAAAEKAGIALGAYNPLADTTYGWPGQSADSIVDLSYVQVWLDNAYLQIYRDAIGAGDTIAPVANYQNRVRASATNWITNGVTYPRTASLYDRDVELGDIVRLDYGGETLWTTVSALIADVAPSSVASATTDSGDKGPLTEAATTVQSTGANNYITLTSGNTNGAAYDGSATGDLSEVYTVVVTTGSVGGDATLARLAVTTASGHDNQVSVQPAAFETAFAIGTRRLLVTFTTDSTRSVDMGQPSGDFVVGQTWQITVNQTWTPPAPTSSGTYGDSTSRNYVVTVSRGGLYQVPLPIAAPTATPIVSATGGGSTGGTLQAGTYYLKYTWVNAAGETTPSPESVQFIVAAGNIPQVTIPALPSNVTSATIYLTPTNGASGTEISYLTGVATTTVTLSTNIATEPGLTNTAVGTLAAPSFTPTVNPTGGGATGGLFPAGLFYIKYTYTNGAGESPPSPESAQFTVGATNIPTVTLPALPTGATGINLYVTPANAPAGSEYVLYASSIATTTYNMSAASPKLLPTTNTSSPSVTNPTQTLSVSATGGGSSGGKLPAGNYYCTINYNGSAGQTLANTESAVFTVAAGNIPQISGLLASAPTNATTFNVWLTPAGGGSGSEMLYASAVAFATTYNLTTALPTTSPAPPGSNNTNPIVVDPSVTPTVNVTGGGSSGGNLPPGTYYVKYTFRNAGGESLPSTASLQFTVVAGDIPQVILPTLSINATSVTLYLTPTGGASSTVIKYRENITGTTVNLAGALPIGVFIPVIGSATFTVANPTVVPTVNVTGGGSTGGHLPAGTYKLTYRVHGNVAGTTLVQGTEVTFTIGAGNIPQVTISSLPAGATGATIYLTQPGGASGSETRFPSAVNQVSPISLNASATSALVGMPPIAITATYTGANPNPPQITATSAGAADSSGPTSITAAATPVAVGSKGVLIAFSGAGLSKGDIYGIQTTGTSAGPYRTIVLRNNMSANMQSATDVTLTLYIKDTSLQLPQQRLSAPPAVNWIASAANLIVKAGANAYAPGWTNVGVPLAAPIVSGPDTVLYAHYRAWLATYAGSVNVAPALINIAATLGTIDPDNPLAFAVSMAAQNANDTVVQFSAIADPTNTELWSDALTMLVGLADIYSLVPLTTDPNVWALYQTHIDTRSSDTVGGEWRVGWFALAPTTSKAIVDSATTTDSNVASATVSDDPDTAGTQYTYVACTSRNAQFVTSGVTAGDIFRFLYTQDAYGTVSWTEYVVALAVNEDTLKLATGPGSAVGTPQRFEIWRNSTKDQIATDLAAMIAATADSRIRYVWPDQISVGGTIIPGYFLCAALAAYTGGIAPQQGLRNLAITGFDSPVARSVTYFNNAQLNTLQAAGCTIITSDAAGNVFATCALTSDQTSLDTGLEQSVRNNDGLKYLIYNQVSQFFGSANITQTSLNKIQVEVQSGIQLGKAASIDRVGALMTDASITTLKQHATILNRIVLVVTATFAYPVDDASITIVI